MKSSPALPGTSLGGTSLAVKREIGVFLIFLAASSGVFYGLLLLSDETAERWLSSALPGLFMWCPGMSALLTCLWMRRKVRGLGWSWGGIRHYATAYLLPLAFGLPAYALIWWIGWGDFDPARLDAVRVRSGLPESSAGTFATILVILAVAPLGMLSTLGEELGWRGFLVPRLAKIFDLRRTSVIVGLLWSLWHYPLIFLVLPHALPDLPLWFGTVCFTLIVVAASGVYTWLRMSSGSVFPAALLHATSNAFLFGLDGLTVHHTPYLSHEYGLGLAISVPLVSWPFWRRLRKSTESSKSD